MKKGIILYIGGFELPDKNAAAHRVLSNAKIFREAGKKVVFIGVDKSLSPNYSILSSKSEVQGFEAYAVPYPKGRKEWINYLSRIENYVMVCKKLAPISMVILYNFQALAMKKMITYCKKNEIRCCADVTEWRSAGGEKLIYRILKNSDTWYRMKILHKKLDGLIVISRYLEMYYGSCKNVIYLPTLTDLEEIKWQGDNTRSETILKLVYGGNPGHKDRIDRLIGALLKVKRDYVLDVIGITKSQFLDMYPQYADNLENCKKIIFHGRLSHLETLEYIKNANYSCFFRTDDRVSCSGFPTKFAEAITCGTPVLTNRTSNIEEYSQKEENAVLLDSINIGSIAEIIENLPFRLNVNKDTFDYKRYINAVSFFTEALKL